MTYITKLLEFTQLSHNGNEEVYSLRIKMIVQFICATKI